LLAECSLQVFREGTTSVVPLEVREGWALAPEGRALVKAGDKVKVIGIPPDAIDDGELHTRSLFEKCLGKSFVIARVGKVEGLDQGLAMLEVGHVLEKASHMETIWVEEEYLEIQEPG
jgi:hypothetical protein